MHKALLHSKKKCSGVDVPVGERLEVKYILSFIDDQVLNALECEDMEILVRKVLEE